MGGNSLPAFILGGSSIEIGAENYELPPIWGDLDAPMDQVYLHPYVSEDPMWWPGLEPFFDFGCPETGMSLMLGPTSWGPRVYEETCGGSMPYKIMGIAKDAGGLPKAGCRAILRRSYDDVQVQGTITDTLGIYAFGVGDTTTLYYVEVFQASPALAGVSVRTLTGA